MAEIYDWFTQMEHTKPLALVMFFVTFVGIMIYVFAGKGRSDRLESYKHIPLDDDNERLPTHGAKRHESAAGQD